MELLNIYKISPDPSLLKRATQMVPGIFIISIWKREFYHLPFGQGALIFPLFPPHYIL